MAQPSGSAVPSVTESPSASPPRASTLPPSVASPTDSPVPAVTPPAALANFRTLDVSKFEGAQLPVGPEEDYGVGLARGRGVLTYSTAHASGSISLPLTKAEIATLSDYGEGCCSEVLWYDNHVVVSIFSLPRPPAGGWGVGGCAWSSETRAWRILVAPLDQNGKPGAFLTFAAGNSDFAFVPGYGVGEGGDCAYTSAPHIGLEGDLIAYNVETPTGSAPGASQILVRSLADGSTVRDIDTSLAVVSLNFSSSNLAWMETSGQVATSLRIGVSTAAKPSAAYPLVFKTPGDTTDWNPPRYFLEGDNLVWEGFNTGKIWLRNVISSAGPRQVSPTGLACELDDFDGANLAIVCAGDAKTLTWQEGFESIWPILWSAKNGYRLLAGQSWETGSTRCSLVDGYLSVDFSTYDQITGETTTTYVIPPAVLQAG